jgi:hypothetical protein
MSLSNREFLIWRERGRGERERGVGRQAGIFKVRLGLGEIQRYRDTEIQRDREKKK